MRERPLHGMEDDDRAQVAAESAQQAPRRAARERVAQDGRQPRDRAVANARRVGRDDAGRAQQVARLVFEDEPLQRPRQQQQGARLWLRHARTVAWRLMRSLFTRLLTGGAAYQASSIVSAALALVTLPLYTRALTKADFGIAETLLTFIILASILLRFGLGEAFVRLLPRDRGGQRPRAPRGDDGRDVLAITTAASLLGRRRGRAAEPAAVRLRGRGDHAPRRARPVGVHEPRDRLRAAARGGAPAHVPARVAGERRRDGRRSRSCWSSSSTRARAATSPATTSARRSCCSACGGRCATVWAGTSRRPTRAAASAAALRRPDRSRRRDGLRAERRRPRVHPALAERRRRGPVRAVGEARDGRHPRRARLSARMAAARLLDHRRRARAAASTPLSRRGTSS